MKHLRDVDFPVIVAGFLILLALLWASDNGLI